MAFKDYPYTQSSTDVDPFQGGTKTPSLSWKGLPIGSTFVLRVIDAAKLLHSRNFETNLPDYWDAEQTQPKMSAVVNVCVLSGPHSVGEERSVWAMKPSNLFVAIAEAQKGAGSKIAPGGTLTLQFAGETPHENKRYSPIKNYVAKYVPPVGDDAFSAPVPPAQYAQPAQPAQPAQRPYEARGWSPEPQHIPRALPDWPQATPQQHTSNSPGTPTATPSRIRW